MITPQLLDSNSGAETAPQPIPKAGAYEANGVPEAPQRSPRRVAVSAGELCESHTQTFLQRRAEREPKDTANLRARRAAARAEERI